jgi:DoxX-like protein
MATAAIENAPLSESKARIRLGWAMSGIAIAFLGADAAGKLLAPELMLANTPAELGLPADAGFYRLLGGILAVCTAFYAWSRTAAFGAVLLTGYLGGAVATHLSAGSPLLTNTLFGVYVGAPVWGGLWLRDGRLRTPIN